MTYFQGIPRREDDEFVTRVCTVPGQTAVACFRNCPTHGPSTLAPYFEYLDCGHVWKVPRLVTKPKPREGAPTPTKAGIVDLRFHDLRHEAGSRLLEAGFQIHQVREMLGHANVAQTSTYLNAGRMGLQEAMKRIDASRCNPVAITPESEPPTDRNDVAAETPKHLVN